jgi:hypothetical protein
MSPGILNKNFTISFFNGLINQTFAELLSEYQKLPSKKLYSGYVKSKSEPVR